MTFVADPHGMQQLLSGPEGPVAKILARAAVRVESHAKLNATGRQVAGANNPEGRGPRVRTGRLRSSITWVIDVDAIGLYAAVGTNVVYGRYLELGLRGGRTYPFLKPALAAI